MQWSAFSIAEIHALAENDHQRAVRYRPNWIEDFRDAEVSFPDR
jgi:hypothetical protein